MKKLLVPLLILIFAFSMSLSTHAEEIAPSSQQLIVNGTEVNCIAFNIDGYNYFRLRDLAKILSGTENCFNVDYDKYSDTVIVTTGSDYSVDSSVNTNESDALTKNTDISVKATQSVQKLIINGTNPPNITAYNINGYNYFKLAELKNYLGFSLDYNEDTRSIFITTTVDKQNTANPKDYQKIYEAISSIHNNSETALESEKVAAPAPTAMSAETSGIEMKSAASDEMEGSDGGYSGTNVQVEGIDEGDIVKTDGEYIYIIRNGQELTILKANGQKTDIISRTTVGWYTYCDGNDYSSYYYSSESKNANQLFVTNGKLAVISDFSSFVEENTSNGWQYEDKSFVCIDIYDITDPASPSLVVSYGQDGYSRDTRMLNNKIYIASDYWIWNEVESNPMSYIPRFYKNGTPHLLNTNDIYIGPHCDSSEYVVLCSYDLENAVLDRSVSLLGGCDYLYMNNDNIYTFDSHWSHTETAHYSESVYTVVGHLNAFETVISRFDLRNGMELTSIGVVPGYLDGQFSADEYNGFLRVVTTSNNQRYYTYEDKQYGFINYRWDNNALSNGLYVLDDNLIIVGMVDNLADGERVYSVRFDGEIAYFCTYRNVDPLFSVDVSNPTEPKVLGALKISGFSEYLHSWGKDRLFGFGQESNEDTGWNEGLKLVMFDTTDKTNITIENYLVIDASYSEALYNHKAFFIDSEKNIIGFLGDDDYYIFTYTAEDGFNELCHFWFDTNEWNVRGLWIENWAYIVGREEAMLLDMNTWSNPIPLKLSK